MFRTDLYTTASPVDCNTRSAGTLLDPAALYQELSRKTQEHIHYLSSIGLGERAKGIQLNRFPFEEMGRGAVDLVSFSRRTAIPSEACQFNPQAKNTLITTDPDVLYNKPEDLQKILDIRLYPTLRELIKENKIEVFLGTKDEMAAHYRVKGLKIVIEFIIPSSAIYYLAITEQQELFVIMSGLVGRENLIAQLITLKLAGINIETIEIIGEIEHFSQLVEQDLELLLRRQPDLQNGEHSLIVAGCGLEEKVNHIITTLFQNELREGQSFKGNILSLTSHRLMKPMNGVHGVLSLHLNYGEITEKVVKQILKICHCKYVFTGGAGGYLSQPSQEQRPEIGSRVAITKSMNEKGEVAWLNEEESLSQKSDTVHLQISSIFLETYEWLEKARKRGSSVDVETFYIIRAVQEYNKQHPHVQIQADCGYFVSDYVGERPLRDYSKVYEKYSEVLSGFLARTLKNFQKKPEISKLAKSGNFYFVPTKL